MMYYTIEPCKDSVGDFYFVILDGDTKVVKESDLWKKDSSYSPGEKAYFQHLTTMSWPYPRINIADREKDLSRIYERVLRYIRNYVYLTCDEHYEYVATWVISTYLQHPHFGFRYSPLLIIDGVTQAGKSTLLKVLREVVYRGSYASGYTAASIARDIEDYSCTMLIDEAMDNLAGDKGTEILQIVKNSFERSGAVWKRADPKGRRNFSYSVYAPIAISTKADILPEDVVNRGIRIPMVMMPPDYEVGDIDSVWEDDRGDENSPDTIRNDLYAYRIAHMRDSRHVPGLEDWREARKTTTMHLTTRAEDGTWMYEYATGVSGGKIFGRNRNIASTMYTIGAEIGAEIGVLTTIIRNNKYTKDVINETTEAKTFHALVDCITEKWNEETLFLKTLTREDFCRIVGQMTTTDVADMFNRTLGLIGDAGRDPVPTRTITAKLLALGFRYERGTNRSSWLKPLHPDFIPRFLENLRVYSPEQCGFFEGISEQK